MGQLKTKELPSDPEEAGRHVRTAFPRYTINRLAAAMGIPVDTAKNWIYLQVSPQRRAALAAVIRAELDRQDAQERADAREWCRQQLAGLAVNGTESDVLAGHREIDRAARGGCDDSFA